VGQDLPAELAVVARAAEERVQQVHDRRRGTTRTEDSGPERYRQRRDGLGPTHRLDVRGRIHAGVDQSQRCPVHLLQRLFDDRQGFPEQVWVVIENGMLGAGDRADDGAATTDDLQLGEVEDPFLLVARGGHQQVDVRQPEHRGQFAGPAQRPVVEDQVLVAEHRLQRPGQSAKHLSPRGGQTRWQSGPGTGGLVNVRVGQDTQHRRGAGQLQVRQLVGAGREYWQGVHRGSDLQILIQLRKLGGQPVPGRVLRRERPQRWLRRQESRRR
jgi:hypothetical protein